MSDWNEVRYDLDRPGNFREISNSPWYEEAEYARFTDAEFARRHAHARELMSREGLDALLLTGGANIYSMGAGVTWGSGLIDDRGMCQYLLLPAEGDPTLVYPHPGCHIEAVRRMVSVADVRGIEAGSVAATLAGRLRELGLGSARVGVTATDRQGPEYMGVAVRDALLSELPDLRLEWQPTLLHELTYLKSDEELRAMERAGELVVAALEAVVALAAPGVREHELAGAATKVILDGGGKVHLMMIGSTNTADPKLVFPNPNPSRRQLRDGDIILSEIAATYMGYSAKVGHPIVVGEVGEDVQRFFRDVLLRGFETIHSSLNVGTTLQEVYDGATVFREAGAQSRPIVCHGLDLITSGPMVTTTGVRSDGFDDVLQPGMTMNIEITPINAEGTFGMFMSRSMVIEEDGPRDITPFPRDRLAVAGR